MKHFEFFYIILLYGSHFCDADTGTLRFVHTLWRHGDRTPLQKTFPTDTGNPPWTWPEGLGELTAEGMRQQYELGSYLRKRYVDSGFLSKEYNPNEIYIRSTSYNRTIMSALSNLAGMYPPSDNNQWRSGTNWQPIPVHSIPRMDDPMLWPDRFCPTANDILYDEVLKTKEAQELEARNYDFLNFLRNNTGLKLPTLIDIWKYVYDPLVCEQAHNHTWPSWVTPKVFNQIEKLFFQVTRFFSHDPRLQRLRGGLLFSEIANRLLQKARELRKKQGDQLKYYAYSAHDITIVAQLENFGAYGGMLPPYASALLYELQEKQSGKYTVEVYYTKDQGATEPKRITVTGCNAFSCDVETFAEIAKNRTPTDWYTECGLTNKINISG